MSPLITFHVAAREGAVLVTLAGDVSGERFIARMAEFFAARPDLAAWHRIYDLTLYTGSIGHADVKELARLLPPRRCTPRP